MTPTPTFQRARSDEHKSQRREAILEAARDLALRDGVREISLADIATLVGIHKSALLRYFESREQIFLELSARAWKQWATATQQTLSGATPESVPALLANSFASRPLLCDLIAHTALNLERHVSVEGVRTYKLASLGAVTGVGNAVAAAVPGLTPGQGLELVSAAALLAGGMWQIANPPAPLAQLYKTDAELAHACVDLKRDLARRIALLLAGLEALGPLGNTQPLG
jgi:AcrR family transcriptional regulator